MAQATISLSTNHGDVRIATDLESRRLEKLASLESFDAIQRQASQLLASFESGYRPFADPVMLTELGCRLRDDLLPPDFVIEVQQAIGAGNTRLLFRSVDPVLLNLPWELLPGVDGQFLVNDARCSIRRTVRDSLPVASFALVAPPLRVLFAACAPTDLTGLDYEKEEEAILRIAHQLGGRLHLDFAESGTFEELRDLVSEYQPHIVHLSGHSSVQDGIGSFAFENERGTLDSRDAREMAEQLFAGRGVRMVFVNGCQSAQAAATGVCQTLTATGYVPLALGWGASIADDRATDFTRVFFHELAAGQSIDLAASTARRDLLSRCRKRQDGIDLLDASFALPQIYAADDSNELVDQRLPTQPPARPGVRYELLGDNIRGLREGFVGRRRLLQNTRPILRSGEKNILLLTGIGGAGKSTFTTRLANRFVRDGYRVVALQARREEAAQFCLRLMTEMATACQRLGREADERVLLDGNRPLENRLRLAVEILNEARILLVLDNLEALMPLPPSRLSWEFPEFGSFFHELVARLTGHGRAILTCRYLPADLDPGQPNLAHEQMPEFTEADFFKYLGRRARVQQRIDRGELTQNLLELFYRKLGATPRFLEQATAILSTVDAERLLEQLERLASPLEGTEGSHLWQLQQEYFRDIFLPQLYEALPPTWRLALSRIAIMEEAIPLDGVESVGGLDRNSTEEFVWQCLGLTLLQQFGEANDVKLFAIYPLQREFFTDPTRLPASECREAHRVAGAFLRRSFEEDRERELRLHFMTELFACLQHSTAAGDLETKAWAAEKLGWQMIRHAEFRSAMSLVEPLLDESRHPDLLRLAARCATAIGDWHQARQLTEEEQSRRQAIGDRAGEAATWHQLATIDLSEGNYASAREKFEKSLAMRQAIGDRAGEAATWHQLATIDVHEGNYASAREKFEKSLARSQAIGDRATEAATWHNLAAIDVKEGNYASAREKLEKSLAMRQAIGDRAGEAATWHQLATIDGNEGNYASAREKLEKSLAMRQAIGDRAGEAATWHQLATIDLNEGNYASAQEKFEKSLAIKRAIGDRAGEAATWHQLATIDLNEGNYASAREKFEKSLAIKRAIGDRAGEAATWHQLATIDLNEGNSASAREKLEKSLVITQAIGNRAGEAATCHNLATIDLNEGNYASAREKFEKSLAMRQAIGDRAGEAGTFYQIGYMAWKTSRRDPGIRLVALCLVIERAIGSGGVQETLRGLLPMAEELNLDEDGLARLLDEVAQEYQRDRGAGLVRQAFAETET